jgi:hypothetical protein
MVFQTARRGPSFGLGARSTTMAASLFSLALLSACGSRSVRQPDTEYLDEGETSGVDRYMPLEDGLVYRYDTKSSRGEMGTMNIQVGHTRRGIVDVQFGGRLEHLRVDTTGIRFVDGGYLLKPPLNTKASWEGRFGIVKVASLDEAIDVPAGTFRGCAMTKEQGLGRAAWQVTSIYCPHVGLVSLDLTREGGAHEVALLHNYGPRVDPLVDESPAPPEQ